MNIMNQSELLIYPDERVLPTNRVSISASLSENILHELKTFFHVQPKNARDSFMIENGSKRIISKNAFENNIYVPVDSNGKITDITNFYVPAEDEKIALFASEADFIPETVERDTFTENLISHMTDKLEGYELIADDFIDRDYRHLVWVRRLSNGIQNTFQNVKIIIDVPHQIPLFSWMPSIYLPPYSPDFNPIEKMWSKLKALFRKLKLRSLELLTTAIPAVFTSITSADSRGWFSLAGY